MNRFLWIASFALAAGLIFLDWASNFMLAIVAMGSASPGSSALPVLIVFFVNGAIYGLAIIWFARWLVKEIQRRSVDAEFED